jgi:hypothetical protein
MKTKLLIVFLFFGAVCFARQSPTGYDWFQAWVDKKILSRYELRPDVLKRLSRNSIKLVLLPKTEIHEMKNGNTYLKCYLINNTWQSISIQRSDATIQGFTTEIYKNGQWLTFQFDLGLITPRCGNSFWRQKLNSGKSLFIKFDHMEAGNQEVLFRLKYNFGKKVIYSNSIKVEIDEAAFMAVPRSPRI